VYGARLRQLDPCCPRRTAERGKAPAWPGSWPKAWSPRGRSCRRRV